MTSKALASIGANLLLFTAGMGTAPSLAQNVVLDGRLGPAQTLQGPVYDIGAELGTAVEANLFHSFSQFGLEAGEQAIFRSAGIRNIFSRITGADASSIDGLLFTDSGSVNLFLINPNGIVFGPNARLDVGGSNRGSFVATTLDGFLWPDGAQFSAVAPQGSAPLLTIAGEPSGLVVSPRELGAIALNNSQLSVYSGQSLLLIGGELSTQGGELAVDGRGGGRIELAGVAAPDIATGMATLPLAVNGNDWSLRWPGTLLRADLQLLDTDVQVWAEGGGQLSLYGRNIDLRNGTRLLAGISADAANLASVQAGDIRLDAQGRLAVQGESTRIVNQVLTGERGNAGTIMIVADTLDVSEGARLDTSSRGIGDAGDISVLGRAAVRLDAADLYSELETADAVGQAGDVVITAPTVDIGGASFLGTRTFGTGDAGEISIRATVLNIAENSELSTGMFGTGNAGQLSLQADQQMLIRESRVIATLEEGGVGQGGDLWLNAPLILLTDRSAVGSATFEAGNAGEIQVTTDILEISNDATLGSSTSKSGNAGAITIQGNQLRLINNGTIVSKTVDQATGSAGEITIQMRDRLDIIGSQPEEIPVRADGQFITNLLFLDTGIFSNSNGDGDAGTIDIQTDQLTIRDGGLITSAAASVRPNAGQSASLNIQAKDVFSVA